MVSLNMFKVKQNDDVDFDVKPNMAECKRIK
jgi:hypothetical protein